VRNVCITNTLFWISISTIIILNYSCFFLIRVKENDVGLIYSLNSDLIILIILFFQCKLLCSNSSLLKIFTDTLWKCWYTYINPTWSWTNKTSGEILHQSHDQHIRICHLSVITNSWAQCYKIFLTNDDNFDTNFLDIVLLLLPDCHNCRVSDILCVLNHIFDLCEILEMPILKLRNTIHIEIK